MGKFGVDTVSGGSTVTYELPRRPAPIQSPGTAVSGRSNATMRLRPGPAGIRRGEGRERATDSGLPAGAPAARSAALDVFSCPLPSASPPSAILGASPGLQGIPLTST